MELLHVKNVSKSFTLHVQGGIAIKVMEDVDLIVRSGEAIALTGASGSGKSTLMRMLYGNYRCDHGSIKVHHDGDWIELAGADPHLVMAVRRDTIGYISQFLRVIPRVPTLQVVAEPLQARGLPNGKTMQRAADLLARLNIPEDLWSLSPVTFSGGEQQRVNIARGFAASYPIMLLDEPTASLDANNRQTVLEMIEEARDSGAAIIGIFHDDEARQRICKQEIKLERFSKEIKRQAS